jgi:ComF family protein
MKLINLIFPKKCVFCGEFTGGEALCPVCAAKYEQMKLVPCKRCGEPQSLCRCRAEKLWGKREVRARHLFAYDGEMAKSLIYKLKRKNLSSLQEFFAHELALLIRQELRRGEKYIITYAPRSKKSVREYGFDQAELLAKGASKSFRFPIEDVFERESGANTEQKKLGAAERAENAKSAFRLCEGAEIEGKTLIIIDDVTTTGSTAARLCELALSAGAAGIVFISVAKT